MMLVLSAAAALLMAPAEPAPATSPAAQPQTASAAPSPHSGRARKDGRVCRAEPVLGSRLPVTLCATSAQWEERKQDDKAKVDEIQRRVRNVVPEG